MRHDGPVREGRILDEQLEYYDSRASTYDQVYAREGRHDQGHDANERWLSDLREIEARLAGAQLTGQVLELGCGTAYWTRHLAATAERVTAVDGSERMLEAARQRLEGNSAVEFQRTDLVRTGRWATATTQSRRSSSLSMCPTRMSTTSFTV
jgi:SAM-dependent methyltransferase